MTSSLCVFTAQPFAISLCQGAPPGATSGSRTGRWSAAASAPTSTQSNGRQPCSTCGSSALPQMTCGESRRGKARNAAVLQAASGGCGTPQVLEPSSCQDSLRHAVWAQGAGCAHLSWSKGAAARACRRRSACLPPHVQPGLAQGRLQELRPASIQLDRSDAASGARQRGAGCRRHSAHCGHAARMRAGDFLNAVSVHPECSFAAARTGNWQQRVALPHAGSAPGACAHAHSAACNAPANQPV